MTQTASTPDNPANDDKKTDLTAQKVIVTAADLPLHCPSAKAPLWSLHPRVFLDIIDTGSVQCPYCGTQYELAPGTPAPEHSH